MRTSSLKLTRRPITEQHHDHPGLLLWLGRSLHGNILHLLALLVLVLQEPGGHIGFDVTRTDTVDIDAHVGPLHGETLGKEIDSSFGGVVEALS
jgi:hypothetical protein